MCVKVEPEVRYGGYGASYYGGYGPSYYGYRPSYGIGYGPSSPFYP